MCVAEERGWESRERRGHAAGDGLLSSPVKRRRRACSKPRGLCRGDKLTEEGGELYQKTLAERGKEQTVQATDLNPTVAELVDDFLFWVQDQVKKEKLAPRTFKWYDGHLQPSARFGGENPLSHIFCVRELQTARTPKPENCPLVDFQELIPSYVVTGIR